jgi:hypothetical protein
VRNAAFALFFVALVLVSRNNHPTLELNLIASAIMTLASAAVFGLAGRLHGFSPGHLVRVALTGLVAGAVSAFLISQVYDALRGPDPLRFSLQDNIMMDTAVVLAGWLWASVLTRLAR